MTFYEDCPKCHTRVKVEEVGPHNPMRTSDPIYCPVCHEIIRYKNTMYDFEESVDSLDDTLPEFKAQYEEEQRVKEEIERKAEQSFAAATMLFGQYQSTNDRRLLLDAQSKILDALSLVPGNSKYLLLQNAIKATIDKL